MKTHCMVRECRIAGQCRRRTRARMMADRSKLGSSPRGALLERRAWTNSRSLSVKNLASLGTAPTQRRPDCQPGAIRRNARSNSHPGSQNQIAAAMNRPTTPVMVNIHLKSMQRNVRKIIMRRAKKSTHCQPAMPRPSINVRPQARTATIIPLKLPKTPSTTKRIASSSARYQKGKRAKIPGYSPLSNSPCVWGGGEVGQQGADGGGKGDRDERGRTSTRAGPPDSCSPHRRRRRWTTLR